jgi:SAM-dependent methyltransferase
MKTPEHAGDTSVMMSKVYDYYFSSAAYGQRYPAPNRSTLDFILEQGAREAANILDVGCGNGRYAMSLLDESNARITGCDISSASLNEFACRLQHRVEAKRVELVHGSIDSLGKDRHFDLILMMFGVLAHIGGRRERINMLRAACELLAPRGRLILSVPNLYRRRPGDLLKALAARAFARPVPGDTVEPGDIHFTRCIAGRKLTFFYHLYSVSELRGELADAGFQTTQCRAESFLPEWLITQYRCAAAFDRLIQPYIPAALGYGICIAATAATA